MYVPEASENYYKFAIQVLGDIQLSIMREAQNASKRAATTSKSSLKLCAWNSTECYAYIQSASIIADVISTLCARVVKKNVDIPT